MRPVYISRLESLFSSNQVIAITGTRRAGKSFIIRQMIKNLINNGHNSKDIMHVNFEDPRFTESGVSLLGKIFETYQEYISPQNKPILFVDEIQEIEGFEKWVRMMHELSKAKLIICGSNALLLSQELGTLLTGRHLDMEAFSLKRFSFKVKEQEKSPRKIYEVDTGLCNAVGFRFLENYGRLAENIVFVALTRKQSLNPDMELFYWKDARHHEVDFVIKEGLAVTSLIQVCWNMRDEKTKNRELRSLRKAMKELKIDKAAIITEDAEGEEKEITNIFSNVDKRIQQSEAKKQILQALFKSMLQFLMTGQVRVKDIDFGEVIA